MVYILKKYSRAAGDRSQWKKVEAMFDNSERRRERRKQVLGWRRSREPIPPLHKANEQTLHAIPTLHLENS